MARGGGAFVCALEGFAQRHRGFLKVWGCVRVRRERETGNKEVSSGGEKMNI